MAIALSSSKSAFLSGAAVARPQFKAQAKRAQRSVAPVQAKYGDESQFFDLDDLENTAGSWDLYGQQDERRYPGLQAEFFERAANPLTRRESAYAFAAALGFVGIGIWGAQGSKALKLPITEGPKKGGEKGPRGRL